MAETTRTFLGQLAAVTIDSNRYIQRQKRNRVYYEPRVRLAEMIRIGYSRDEPNSRKSVYPGPALDRFGAWIADAPDLRLLRRVA